MALFFYKEKNKDIRAAAYLRLSIEDGDKAESNSIGNQRELIRDFALELFKFVLGIVRDRYNIVLELFQVTSHFFAFQASLSFSFYRAAAVICRYRSQQHRQSAFPA